MAWSEQQLAAINTANKNLLVAAAAGSGKTSVLVERIIQKILNEDEKLNIDQVLVLTFTNAAATEMRERIAGAITKALTENHNSKHLEKQLVLLNMAAISTIHSFCQNIIKQNFHVLNIDPKFRLANEQEINLLRYDVIETLFEEKYEEGNPEFLKFVDHYGNDRNDEALYNIVLNLYKFSCSHPFPTVWLEQLRTKFVIDAKTIDQTEWASIVKEQIDFDLQEALAYVEELIELASQLGFEFYLPTFETDKKIILAYLENLKGNWDGLRTEIFAYKPPMLKVPKGIEVDEIQKKIFQDKRNKVKDLIKNIKEHYFQMSGADLLSDLAELEPMVKTITDLTLQFSENFARAKAKKAILDFNDLEHFCLKILKDESSTVDKLVPSAVALMVQEKYQEVMVDEYQDTNGVQEAILSLVRKQNKPNLFLVGDVKQSIYRFRLAEPELFLEKYNEYPELGADFARIELAQNFRSRKSVLAGINFIFAQIMSPKVGELDYTRAEWLNPGPDYPTTDQTVFDDKIEFDLIAVAQTSSEESEEEELSGFKIEAEHIAQKIKKLLASETYVFNKETQDYEALQPKDIVILLRSVKNKASVLLESLKNNDLPAYANLDSGYFQELEVKVLLALLDIIDNPRQDIHLATVLYSPILGLSTTELAQLRIANLKEDLWSCLVLSCEDETLEETLLSKIRSFKDNVLKWRALATIKSVPELIWQLFEETGYYDYVGGMPGGLLRQANLRMLYDRAEEYEQTNYRGLFRFLRFVDKIRDGGNDLAVARTLGESENVIRIMSIHKSKGLEFPVVILADMGKKINLQDSKSELLMHKKLGLGPYVTKDDLNLRYHSIARRAIAYKMNMESRAEELRILYVALTRAREKLILVGSVKKIENKTNEWCREVGLAKAKLPDYLIAKAQSYLDWVAPAIARHHDGSILLECGQCLKTTSKIIHEDYSQWSVNIINSSDIKICAIVKSDTDELLSKIAKNQFIDSGGEEKWVQHVLGWQYENKHLQEIPAKLTVTELKRQQDFLADGSELLIKKPDIIKRPQFIQQKTTLTGAEYGTLLHTVMQYLDFQQDLSLSGLKIQLEELVRSEKIAKEQAVKVDLETVAAFFNSDLGQRLLKADLVKREMPFGMMVKACEFYHEVTTETEEIFIQGIIDLLFMENDKLILVDYKTDKGVAIAEVVAKYKLQLELYSRAIEAIFKKPVAEKYLYLFSNNSSIRVK